MSKTVEKKAAYKVVVGQDARRSPEKKSPRVKGRRIVLTRYPHSKAGRPKLVDDMVGTPI